MPKNAKKIIAIIIIILIVGVSSFFTWWWNFYLINQGEFNKDINQFEDTEIENNYYPRPAMPSHLYSINMSNLKGDEAVTILTLAGVLAKGVNGPQIYVEDDGGYYSQWTELIRDEGINITVALDPWALVSQSKGNLSGYILYKSDTEGVQQSNDPILSADTLTYEHQDESYCVAVSLCGILNACAVEVANESQAIAAGLTMTFDARCKDVDWLFNSSYWSDFRHDMIFEVEHHTSRRLMLIDYPVFCGAPVWHAQTHEKRAEYLKSFEADSPSFGWGAVGPMDEAGLNMQVSAAGGFFMPSDWARDLSVFAAIPVTCQQKPLPEIIYEENVHLFYFILQMFHIQMHFPFCLCIISP